MCLDDFRQNCNSRSHRACERHPLNMSNEPEDFEEDPYEGRPSKSLRKRNAHEAQDVGEELIRLKERDLKAFDLPEALYDAIVEAQRLITSFVKAVPATGRSQILQRGELALTIVNPEQYRDEIYKRIAAAVQRAVGFYGSEYGAEISGLDREIAWAQVSNTEVFLYVPYSFVIEK